MITSHQMLAIVHLPYEGMHTCSLHMDILGCTTIKTYCDIVLSWRPKLSNLVPKWTWFKCSKDIWKLVRLVVGVKVHHAQGSSTIPGVGCQRDWLALAMSIWTLGLSIMQEEQQKYKTQCNKKMCLLPFWHATIWTLS
jgi:hypothetical protein